MSNQDRDAILQAAAKTLVWELYEVAGYGRIRTQISVERFDEVLRAAAEKWSATRKNLKRRKEQ